MSEQENAEMTESYNSRLNLLEKKLVEAMNLTTSHDNTLRELVESVKLLTAKFESDAKTPKTKDEFKVPADRPSIDREPRPRSDVKCFSGEAGDWERFWTQVRVFFGMQPITYSSDAHKIAYIYQRLEGEPLKLVTNMWDKPEYQMILSNMNLFKVMMESLYLDINKNENANYEFKRLKQTKTVSNAQHIQRFETLALASNALGYYL